MNMKLFNRKKKKDIIDVKEMETMSPVLESDEEQEEFDAILQDTLSRMPKKTARVVVGAFDKSKGQAEKLLATSKGQFDKVFEDFLPGLDKDIQKRCHSIIHGASLTAAIIGFSPISFSDAILLVPVQMAMMARLHKLFGQSWTESIGKSISKELFVVSFGRSAVGNVLKLFPGVGTVAGGAINAAVASTITEALGWTTVKLLNDGQDIFEEMTSFKGQFNMLSKAMKATKKKTKE